ncbi:unnamed protein product [Mytilus coruscus]|uniref:Uncharacterized protein n=1 Tax=Mytilus coruscus TaxID=42192 RepID=A0A6J8B4R0_MYTCO|nr:unnamed protein product [Mytilus coruscus]
MDENEMYRWFGTSSYFDTYKLTMGLTNITRHKGLMFDGSDMRIGYSKDSVECLLMLILLSCLHFVELHKFYHHPLTIVINWFYRLNLLCDNFDVHCIVDQRLEQKYYNLNSLYSRKASVDHLIVNETTSVAIDALNRESMTEFEQLYRMKRTTIFNESQSVLRRSLVNASENKLSILCRWLLINIRNKGVSNKDIEKAMDIALNNLDRFTARAVSWCITKTFYRTFLVYLRNAYEVYPGLRCECHAKGNTTNPLCSKQTLIIILTEQQLKGLPQRYKGFKIEIHNINDINSPSEGMKLSNQLSKIDSSSHLKVNISKEKAENLFYRHTNLSLICASVHRSFSFQKKHLIKAEICIQFYCKRKGILPLGEQHFPDSIHGIPTDVIEGTALMLSKLHIGDKIGPQTSTGTLGGFVKYLGFDCFLTCAHVMYDLQTLLSSSADFALLPGAKAYSHMTQGLVDCGTVIWRTFDHDDKLKTSIDAALVLLQNTTIDPNDYIQDGMGNPCPYSQLGAGANTKLECAVTFPRQSDVDILFSNTGQTAANVNSNMFQPLWISTSAHMQLSAGYLTEKRIFRMYNQMVINLGLQPGDSGTCIYVVQHPQNKNGCIGMAIAFCAGLTIVTPLKDILKRINTS